jgi:hypothetical protein
VLKRDWAMRMWARVWYKVKKQVQLPSSEVWKVMMMVAVVYQAGY